MNPKNYVSLTKLRSSESYSHYFIVDLNKQRSLRRFLKYKVITLPGEPPGMGRLSERFAFVNFSSICSDCKINCCKRFYAVLLPEEEKDFEDHSFLINTELGSVRAIGSRNYLPCPYLDDTGACSIYVKRPLDCRLWPVILYYDFKTGEKVIYLDLDCPAVASGKLSCNLIENIVEELKKLSLDIDIEWLKKYTLAPWPNHLIEIARIK